MSYDLFLQKRGQQTPPRLFGRVSSLITVFQASMVTPAEKGTLTYAWGPATTFPPAEGGMSGCSEGESCNTGPAAPEEAPHPDRGGPDTQATPSQGGELQKRGSGRPDSVPRYVLSPRNNMGCLSIPTVSYEKHLALTINVPTGEHLTPAEGRGRSYKISGAG